MRRNFNSLRSIALLAALIPLLTSTLFAAAAAPPPRIGTQFRDNRFTMDAVPNLNDVLTVAKSPLEPVTLPPATSNQETLGESQAANESKDTRAVGDQNGLMETTSAASSQESTTSQDANAETTTFLPREQPEATTEAPATTTVGAMSTAVANEESEDAIVKTAELDAAKEQPKAADRPKEEASVQESTTTTTTVPNLSTAATEAPVESSSSPEVNSGANSEETSTAATATTSTLATPVTEDVDKEVAKPVDTDTKVEFNEPTGSLNSTSSKPELSTSEAPATTTTASAPKAQEVTPEANPEVSRETSQEPTTTTELPLKVQNDTKIIENTPLREDSTPASASGTPETTSLENASNPETSTTSQAPAVDASTTTTTSKPTTTTESGSKDDKSSCNHLPSYDSDEMHKVFREEVTYKNGTIKGKFTYVNFDQRYRLVHYTRLPYGPVKIDLVEELGKPESLGGSEQVGAGPATATLNSELPNAVLQLRNILPNSLFGFPFLGNSANFSPNKPGPQAENGDKMEESYFYSTDSISTPNLLSPSVPISLLPGQRMVLQASSSLPHLPAPAAGDILSHSYYENLPIRATNSKLANSKPTSDKGPANENLFQYAISLADNPNEQSRQQPNSFAYALLTPPTAQAQPVQSQLSTQYQYSPLPLYTFGNQANYQYPAGLRQQPTQAEVGARQQEARQVQQQHHQVHDHDHFVAPFMFATPLGRSLSPESGSENPRVKIRIKTSKSLNHQDTYGKSASLRVAGQQQQQQIQSPVANHHRQVNHQHRQRVGKQQNEFRQSFNNQPIVYHVLRSPIGRVYTLPQYNQELALAHQV